VTCLYVNQLHQGAILITKTGKDKNCVSSSTVISNGVCTGASTADLGGATFKVTTDQAGTSQVPGSPVTTSNSTGTACIDGLAWATGGTTYYVFETSPPTGYSADPSNANPLAVTVIQNAKCSDANLASEAAASFNDIPLTNLTIKASAVVPGATSSTITCTNSSNAGIGNSPQSGDPAEVDASNLKPGTYTCTVVIDP